MKPLVVSRGDPSGIGLEILCKAWLGRATQPFLLVDDLEHCRRAAAALGFDTPFAPATPATAVVAFADAIPVFDLALPTRGVPGRADIADAPGTIASMERCVAFVAANETAAVVTLPVSKQILHRVGFSHPGQTEFMGELAARHWTGSRATPVMLLWSPELAVVPATIHVPVADVPALIDGPLIERTVKTLAHDLRRRFNIAQPRIAVSGLNPHAGENGDIGREELDTLVPALARLKGEGFAVTGPHPADTLFHAEARCRYDAAVTMFHDQALIPIKTLAFDLAVNVTLGLPFVRTSPDHGTAYDIAGQGRANPASLVAALQLAARLAAAEQLPAAATPA